MIQWILALEFLAQSAYQRRDMGPFFINMMFILNQQRKNTQQYVSVLSMSLGEE